ncbi:MAG: trypsin-like peptidase domain-containing protein [Planctomycetota bacterium]
MTNRRNLSGTRFLLCCIAALVLAAPASRAAEIADVVARVQRKTVKIYGAGGIRGLEAYQSGFLVSPHGHIATVWSYVLDTDELTVVLDDGSRFPAEIALSQPQLDLAVLKIDATDLPSFDVSSAQPLVSGDRVLAFSNLYGIATGNEPTSVLHGHVSAVCPLAARRGVFQIPYSGSVYVLDAMTNNAGAAGGALTDYEGRLAGMLGKEVKARDHDVWLNYALPASALRATIEAAVRGELLTETALAEEEVSLTPWTLQGLGVELVPNLIKNTPPFVELVQPGSPVAEAGLRPDDLIVYIETQIIQSYNELQQALRVHDRTDAIMLTVVRGDDLVSLKVSGLED